MNEPTRAPSLLSRVIAATAQRLAQHPSIPPASRAAFEAQAAAVMQTMWSDLFGGESVWVRCYVPHSWATDRACRRDRIRAALAAGERPVDIARRERVSERHVRRLRPADMVRVDMSASSVERSVS